MGRPDLDLGRKNLRTFNAKFRRFIEAGLHPIVISRAEHPEPWEAWESYFRRSGLGTQLEMMQHRDTKVVPCLDVAQFVEATRNVEAPEMVLAGEGKGAARQRSRPAGRAGW